MSNNTIHIYIFLTSFYLFKFYSWFSTRHTKAPRPRRVVLILTHLQKLQLNNTYMRTYNYINVFTRCRLRTVNELCRKELKININLYIGK